MNSEVTSSAVITCVTSTVVLLVSFWIVMSFCKMCSKQHLVFSKANDIVIDSTVNRCSSFESVVEEIYDAAKKSNCQDNLEKCINLLRHYPGHVNTPVSKKNFTPFLRACWTGSIPLVKYMLEKGADVSLRSSVGDSAFYLAVHKIVKDKSEWDPSLLKLLYKSGHTAVVDMLTIRVHDVPYNPDLPGYLRPVEETEKL